MAPRSFTNPEWFLAECLPFLSPPQSVSHPKTWGSALHTASVQSWLTSRGTSGGTANPTSNYKQRYEYYNLSSESKCLYQSGTLSHCWWQVYLKMSGGIFLVKARTLEPDWQVQLFELKSWFYYTTLVSSSMSRNNSRADLIDCQVD